MVFLQNGIKFVIVTLGTADSESQQCFAGNIGHFGHDQVPLHAGVPLIPFVNTKSEKSGGDQGFRIVGSKFVSGQLFANKLIIRFVLVE